MYAPLAVANTLILLGMTNRSPMGLNKIVYVAHGFSLAYDRPIVAEMPEIWKYGPIYRNLYDDLRQYTDEVIRRPQPSRAASTVPIIPGSDNETYELLTQVQKSWGHIDDLTLSSFAHKDGSPWKITAAEFDFQVPFGTRIPEYRMRHHFAQMLHEAAISSGVPA